MSLIGFLKQKEEEKNRKREKFFCSIEFGCCKKEKTTRKKLKPFARTLQVIEELSARGGWASEWIVEFFFDSILLQFNKI